MRVESVTLDDMQVCELLELHQRDMHAISPPGTSFALDLSGLSRPDISLFGAWDADQLMAVGALKRITATHAEIKSMRTHPACLGKGAGEAVLGAVLEAARREGILRVSLETGTSPPFEPAVRLYAKHGFVAGEAFANYANGPHNQCYHLAVLSSGSAIIWS